MRKPDTVLRISVEAYSTESVKEAVYRCRVAPGITPLGLPQIRTCRTPASGSSSQVVAGRR